MENVFRVAISRYDLKDYSDVGYIEYNIADKKADIFLKSEEAVQTVKNFFAKALTMQIPHKTAHDFTQVTINPLESLENFKLALTRLWENTNIYVDWSRPVEYVMKAFNKDKVD